MILDERGYGIFEYNGRKHSLKPRKNHHMFDTELLPAKDTPQSIDFMVRGAGATMKYGGVVKDASHTNRPYAAPPNKFILPFHLIGLNFNVDAGGMADYIEILGFDKWQCEECDWTGRDPAWNETGEDDGEDGGPICPQCDSEDLEYIGNKSVLTLRIGSCIFLRVPLCRIPGRQGLVSDFESSYKLTTNFGRPYAEIGFEEYVGIEISWPTSAPRLNKDVLIRPWMLGTFWTSI